MIANRHAGHIHRKVEVSNFFAPGKANTLSFAKAGVVVNKIFYTYQVGTISRSGDRFLKESTDIGVAPSTNGIYKTGTDGMKARIEAGYICNKT